MNNKQAIIDKIISDAEQSAAEILSAAREKAERIVADASEQAEDYTRTHANDAKTASDDYIRRRRSVDGLDSRKADLGAKKRILDELLDEVLRRLRTDRKKDYLALMRATIARSAEDGDEVIVCAADRDLLDEKFVARVARDCGKKLSLGAQTGRFDGGVVLSGKNYDKNLTLDLKIKALREEYETQLSDILFGEKV